MSKHFNARRTHGTFADLIGGQAPALTGKCERCGLQCATPKRYCGPCSAEHHDVAQTTTKLSLGDRDKMVERLLRGEHAKVIAADYGVDKTRPPQRAHVLGFIKRRGNVIRPEDVTDKGRAWLATRPAPTEGPVG